MRAAGDRTHTEPGRDRPYAWVPRVGLVEGGRRFVYEHDALTAIDPDGAAKLEAITPVASALGGGFVW